jgi:hypothetical protein
MKQKQGEWKKGIWTSNNNLQVNNPKGNNQHTDKEKLKKEVMKVYTVDDVKLAYQTMREAYRNYLSTVQLHSEAQYNLLGYRSKVELKNDDEFKKVEE